MEEELTSPFQRSPELRPGSLPPLLGRGMNPRPAPATCRSLCQRKLVQVQASTGSPLDPPTIGSPRQAAGHINRSSNRICCEFIIHIRGRIIHLSGTDGGRWVDSIGEIKT